MIANFMAWIEKRLPLMDAMNNTMLQFTPGMIPKHEAQVFYASPFPGLKAVIVTLNLTLALNLPVSEQ